MPRLFATLTLLFAISLALSAATAGDKESGPTTFKGVVMEMLKKSLDEKKGILFYVNGREVGGGVVRLVGEEAVEIKNQQYGHIILLIDRIDGLAMN